MGLRGMSVLPTLKLDHGWARHNTPSCYQRWKVWVVMIGRKTGKNHEIETGKKCLFFVFTANPLPPRNEDADLKNDGFLPVSISWFLPVVWSNRIRATRTELLSTLVCVTRVRWTHKNSPCRGRVSFKQEYRDMINDELCEAPSSDELIVWPRCATLIRGWRMNHTEFHFTRTWI